MSRRELLIVIAAVALAVGLGVSALALVGHAPPPNTVATNGFQGGLSYISDSQLASVKVSQPVAETGDSLTFGGNSINILVLMGPMTEGQSMYSFVIDNLTNPTLIIPRGSSVTMTVVNVDTDAYHALTLTNVGPPYSYNMMQMMMSSFASTRDLPPTSSSGLASEQISFTVTGSVYYLCPVPGHAQAGMYGLIEAG